MIIDIYRMKKKDRSIEKSSIKINDLTFRQVDREIALQEGETIFVGRKLILDVKIESSVLCNDQSIDRDILAQSKK